MPERLSVVAYDVDGNPIFEPMMVVFIDNATVPGTVTLWAELSELRFSAQATELLFEGSAGSTSRRDTTGPTEDVLIAVSGLVGEADVTVNPELLGFGTFLDEVQQSIDAGQTFELVVSASLDEATGGFRSAGSTADANAALRALDTVVNPRPIGVRYSE